MILQKWKIFNALHYSDPRSYIQESMQMHIKETFFS